MEMLPTQTAVEAFLRGFSATRSFTKPFQAQVVGDQIWVLADCAPGKVAQRTPEFVTYGAEPASVLDAIFRLNVERYMLCVLADDARTVPEVVSSYKQAGHRFMGREPLFVLNLARRVSFSAIPVSRIRSQTEADAIAREARARQILPQHLGEDDSACRLFAAYDGDTPIGWVRSLRTHPDCAWVSNMFVSPEHRRKGIGRSLLSAMLDDDARLGVGWSVLLSSLTGAMLYPHLGYKEQGLLLLFSPTRARYRG